MGWQEDDKSKRAKIAHELDRREFWKECYLINKKNGAINFDAAAGADDSLKIFEDKFPPLHGAS